MSEPTTRRFPPSKPHPELDRLLEEAKARPEPSEEELREQRKSLARQDKD